MVKVLRAILEPDATHAFKSGLLALYELSNAPDQQTFLRLCLTYLTEAGNTLDRESLYTIINEVTSTHLKEEAMSIADQLRQEGRQEGERLILQRQIIRKFGELDYVTQEKLNLAGSEELERWGERILDVKTLEEVFGE